MLGIASSTFYGWLQQAESPSRRLADEQLLAEIVDIHTSSGGTYGSPRVHTMLRRRGIMSAATSLRTPRISCGWRMRRGSRLVRACSGWPRSAARSPTGNRLGAEPLAQCRHRALGAIILARHHFPAPRRAGSWA
ncbi:IS3 family transposase [Nocardia wallacei]|uniref:IS3 family transposase n=1 Tax=Nocardia wallacei TaxID=480035 RepID=UPI003CC7F7C9